MVVLKKSGSLLKNYFLIVSLLVVLISFRSSNQWSSLPIGNEIFWWICQCIFFYCVLKLKNIVSTNIIETDLKLVKVYLYWNIFNCLRGILYLDGYWGWKFLISNTFFLLIPLVAYLPNSFRGTQIIVKFWLKYSLIIFIFFIPFLKGDGVGKFLMPLTFLLLFFPILNIKWKIIILAFSIYVVFFDLSARSNVIKFIVPFAISLLFYFRNFVKNKIFIFLRYSLFFLPIIFLFLGMSGIFNVFKLDNYFKDKTVNSLSVTGEKIEESLVSDTRTFLYREVIASAIKNNYFIFGRTPSRGNDSETFGYNELEKFTKKNKERGSNEVSILNIFTWLGLVGVILYFLIFFRSSYLAIKESNNFFIKLIGLNISFRWAFGFVEDFSFFDLSNIFLWIMIGMCFSKTFRQMSNSQMEIWVLGIIKTPRISNFH